MHFFRPVLFHFDVRHRFKVNNVPFSNSNTAFCCSILSHFFYQQLASNVNALLSLYNMPIINNTHVVSTLTSSALVQRSLYRC
jgi:hypothetical protein